MCVVDPLKFPSSALMTSSDSFKFNPSYVNRSCPNIILYIPLAESSTRHLYVTTFVALSIVKVKYILALRLVVILSACTCPYITASFSGCIFNQPSH